MLRVLYLSKNITRYKSSSYQRDILNELARRAEVAVYGPGYKNYTITDRFSEIVAKVGWRPDCVFVGHRWLSDNAGAPINPHPDLDLKTLDVPLFGFINKEYVNLKGKLAFFNDNPFAKVFSHYHDIEQFNTEQEKFHFTPFAFSPRRIDGSAESKRIDLFFSGVLINPNPSVGQTETRIAVQKKLFFDIDGHLIAKRKPFRDLEIVWNAVPRSPKNRIRAGKHRLFGTMFPKYVHRYFEEHEYSDYIKRAKIVLCSLSPLGLMSPRYFEAMAAGAMVLTESAPQLERVFPRSTYVDFTPDRTMEEFTDKLLWYLTNDHERETITRAANDFVWKSHTWEIRIEEILEEVKKML